MNNTKIKLNGTYEFDIDGFSRNTNVQDGKLVSSAYVLLKDPSADIIHELRSLALYTITSYSLLVNAQTVAVEEDLSAKITSIEESLQEDGKMRVSFYLYF